VANPSADVAALEREYKALVPNASAAGGTLTVQESAQIGGLIGCGFWSVPNLFRLLRVCGHDVKVVYDHIVAAHHSVRDPAKPIRLRPPPPTAAAATPASSSSGGTGFSAAEASALASFTSLGFTDVTTNLLLLRAHQGDAIKTMAFLISQRK